MVKITVYFFLGFVSDQQTFFAGNTSSGNILQVFILLISTGTRVPVVGNYLYFGYTGTSAYCFCSN
jgi:hypothetical protein